MRTRDEQKEAAIRKTAIDMIVQEGFDGLSMQKLAKAAGVSPATIYIYYKNREDLLNSLFIDCQSIFARVALKGFDPTMSFRDGLWLQWQNRLRYVQKYPSEYKFYEQFRNSPLIHNDRVHRTDFRESMKAFVMNAVKRKEIRVVEPEVFWAMAYGPLYTLIKFHNEGRSMMSNTFKLNDKKTKQAFDMVIKAFKP